MTHEHFRCRLCLSGNVETVLDMGMTPLANAILKSDMLDQVETLYPCTLLRCLDCGLVQLGETVSPEELFSDYVYYSSYSEGMQTHAEGIAKHFASKHKLGPDSLVIEIGSNDGYLLKHYHRAGIPVLGIDPASNIARLAAEKHGVKTIGSFFNEALAMQLAEEGLMADVFHSHNSFAHIPTPNDVVAGIKRLLKPDGIAIIEVPSVIDLIDNLEFDTIYHEHFCYYSVSTLDRLMSRHGLEVIDAEHIDIHGGTLRTIIAHEEATGISENVIEFKANEVRWGIDRSTPYATFAHKVWVLRESLKQLLAKLKEEGARIAAYGAGAKGSILLNVFGIGSDVIEYVVDRSPHKHDHYMPGVRLPIRPAETLAEDKPDYVLLLTWNFAEEVIAQQKAYREGGGKFIIPLPEPRIVA